MSDNYNLSVELGIIGSILQDSTILPLVQAKITPEHFSQKSLAKIYEHILEMNANGRIIDLMTVGDSLPPATLASIGGTDRLVACYDSVVSVGAIEEYVDILGEHWRKKQMAIALNETQNILKTSGFKEGFEHLQSALITLAGLGSNGGFELLPDMMQDWYERLKELQLDPALKDRLYLKTGFKDYDLAYGGLAVGTSIIGARPAMGKTSYAICEALQIAAMGKTVLFFSLEMTPEQIQDRVGSVLSGIENRRLEIGDLNGDVGEFEAAAHVLTQTAEMNFFIDGGATEIEQIIAAIERWRLVHQKDPDVVYIDYLGLIDVAGVKGEGAARVKAEVASQRLARYFTKVLKSRCRLLCQLNRGVESRENKRPNMSDLRDSGAIEQDAVKIDFLYRDDYYNPDTCEEPGIVEVITAKNRFGGCQTIKMVFEAETTSFKDYTPSNAPVRRYDEEFAY